MHTAFWFEAPAPMSASSASSVATSGETASRRAAEGPGRFLGGVIVVGTDWYQIGLTCVLEIARLSVWSQPGGATPPRERRSESGRAEFVSTVGVGICEIVDRDGVIRSACSIDWRDLDVGGALSHVATVEEVVRASAEGDERAALVLENAGALLGHARVGAA